MKKLSINDIKETIPGDWEERSDSICLISKEYAIYYFLQDFYLPAPFWCYDDVINECHRYSSIKEASSFYFKHSKYFRFKNFK